MNNTHVHTNKHAKKIKSFLLTVDRLVYMLLVHMNVARSLRA